MSWGCKSNRPCWELLQQPRLTVSKSSIRLDVYGHLFKPTDLGAAAIFGKAFASLQAD